jgi:hypothetical protein
MENEAVIEELYCFLNSRKKYIYQTINCPDNYFNLRTDFYEIRVSTEEENTFYEKLNKSREYINTCDLYSDDWDNYEEYINLLYEEELRARTTGKRMKIHEIVGNEKATILLMTHMIF